MNNDTKTTLLAALPLLLIITALVAAIVILPQTDLDTRDKAAEPKPTITPRTTQQLNPNYQLEPETACTTPYNPVCGTNNLTYGSECEANQAGIQVAYRTVCTTALKSPTASPSAIPTY